MSLTLRIIFISTLACLIIIIGAFTVGQVMPIEFSNERNRDLFYNFGFYAIPILILLTLTGTIKRNDGLKRITLKSGITVLAAVLSIAILISYLFTLGFGGWVDLNIKFRQKENQQIKIVEQLYDIGALGYGEQRIVKIVPFTPWFNYIEKVDTLKLNKYEWTLVNEEGDLKY